VPTKGRSLDRSIESKFIYTKVDVETLRQIAVEWPAVHTVDISASNKEEFRRPFHIILNPRTAASSPAAQPDPASFRLVMRVDHVRVWQRQ
jgi:hypothetical protein